MFQLFKGDLLIAFFYLQLIDLFLFFNPNLFKLYNFLI